MGNSSSTFPPEFRPDLEVLQPKSFDPHYGDVRLVNDKTTSKKWYLKEVTFNNDEAAQAELSLYTKLVNNKHPNIASVVGLANSNGCAYCARTHVVSVFIEILSHNLFKDFEGHKSRIEFYSESELLLITDHILNGLIALSSRGQTHGDIRPANIFVKEGVYKLSEPSLSLARGANGLFLAILQDTQTFLAPELVSQVPARNFEMAVDREKADIFSVGMTLLALATLKDSEELYDYKQGVIKKTMLNERMESVRGRYSDVLYNMILEMLIFDPVHRPDALTVLNKMRVFDRSRFSPAKIRETTSVSSARPTGFIYETRRTVAIVDYGFDIEKARTPQMAK